MENLNSQPIAISLSNLTALVGNAVRLERRIQGVWVTAELSDLRQSGGHFYMELIEKDASGATVAKIRANMWVGSAAAIRRKFYSATGRDLTSGLKVMIYGAVTHHNLYGLSFNIQDIDPTYTMGDLERLRREILVQLGKEGVLEMNRNLEFPVAPQKIAVISAAGAAGYGDFTNQLENSPEHFCFYPLLFGAVMQGDKTAPSVINALDAIEMSIDFWDAVVIIRGGGSTSDLNGFDNLDLARRVATFPLPVIVGIGHERDRTVLDDIACIRCKTPTAVAAFLIDSLRKALTSATDLSRNITRYTSERMEGDKRRLDSLTAMLPALLNHKLGTATLALQQIGTRLPVIAGKQTADANTRLGALASALGVSSQSIISTGNRKMQEMAATLSASAGMPLQRATLKIDHLSQLVGVLSPQNTLKRGYSITRINGKAITKPEDASPGDTIQTTLFGGTITSKV